MCLDLPKSVMFTTVSIARISATFFDGEDRRRPGEAEISFDTRPPSANRAKKVATLIFAPRSESKTENG